MVVILAACPGKSEPVAPCDAAPVVQVLVRGVAPLNTDDGGNSQPVHVTLFELSGASSLNQLDNEMIYEKEQAAFGDEFLAKYDFVVYPDSGEKYKLELKPEVAHIMAVAKFARPIGDAWFVTYRVPKPVCKEPPPCLYLRFERAEVAGGARAPADFDAPAFGIQCARAEATLP